MRKAALFAVAAGLLMAGPALVFAAKTNPSGAQTYGWNLSGAVMPVPPYGSFDIPGSDTASKLIVNQPNGKVGAAVTGVMNGLHPDTTYTVYLSNPWMPYHMANVSGTYMMDVLFEGNHYDYNLTLSQSGSAITGSLYDPDRPGPLAVSGFVTGNTVTFSVDYGGGSIQGIRTFTGTVGATGAMTGTWNETGTEGGNSTWSTTSGSARPANGTSGWPGQLAGTVPFTFTTDSAGSGSWHYNFTAPAPSTFSVWINSSGGTLLVSDDVKLN